MSDTLITRMPEPVALLDHDPANPCPELAEKDFAALRQSIEEHGYLAAWPVVVSAGPACPGEIIDGFHRTKICAELGIAPPTVAVPCPDEAEFLILQVRANLARRQLTEVDRWRLGQKLEQAYSERAVERKASTQFGGAGQLTGSQSVQSGDTRDLVAVEVGLSGKQYERIGKVMTSENETLKAGLESQTLSVYGAFKQLRDKPQQDSIDADMARERQAERELAEHFVTSPEDRAETKDAERTRLVGEAVRRTMELDQLITKNGITAGEVAEFRSRPHTFLGASRRLNEWLGEIEEVL
jgi:hypothetical protein